MFCIVSPFQDLLKSISAKHSLYEENGICEVAQAAFCDLIERTRTRFLQPIFHFLHSKIFLASILRSYVGVTLGVDSLKQE